MKQTYVILKAAADNQGHSIPLIAEIFETDDKASLETLQAAVGGYIEAVCIPLTFPPNHTLAVDAYCNEEGLLIDLPLNPWINGIRGDVILVSVNGEGESMGTPENVLALLRAFNERHPELLRLVNVNMPKQLEKMPNPY